MTMSMMEKDHSYPITFKISSAVVDDIIVLLLVTKLM